jgi:hypothetical protein
MEVTLKTDEVFGISATCRPVSYVDRGQLDNEIRTYLNRDTHIALRGESKCGKSWLRQKNISDAVVVQCRLGKTVNDLYVDALSQLEIKLELESRESSSLKGKVSAMGQFGIKILAALRIGTSIEGEDKEDFKMQTVGHDINDLRFIADALKASGRRLVVEDFHYMSISERKKFAFELKALWDYGLFAIIIGVWSQNNMLLYLNPDLSGRVYELPISWSQTDLEQVLVKGGNALHISFDPSLKKKIIALCYGNVGILQKITLETLDRANVKSKQLQTLNFNNDEALETAALFYAEQLTPLYQQFAKRVAGGIRNRKESTGIYAHAMAVMMDADDVKLINGLNINEIYETSHIRQPRIQKGNLRVVLGKIEELQVDDDGRGLVLAFNEASGDITAVDRQLLLYRRYSTVNWPWVELINEIEATDIAYK